MIVGGEDTPRHKPDPAALLLACSRLDLRPETSVYVGDHPVDAEAAGKACMPFVAVLTGVHARTSFTSYSPLAVISDLSALPQMLIARGTEE